MNLDARFTVPFRFPVCFTADAFAPANRVLLDVIRRQEPDRQHRLLIVIDERVASTIPSLADDVVAYVNACPEHLELAAAPVLVQGGESVKTDISHVFRLLQIVNDVGLDRQSFVLVIGGGAVLDMASFAAAIAHRGIRVVRFPTTVLSQADSGVGVKNGVNLLGKKNFIGTFVPPFAVINDSRFLESLDERERRAGVAEAIKVALLKDPPFFDELEALAEDIASGDMGALAALVRRSAELHLAHICGNGDPFELGSARPLDFGHWAAHKLESMTEHRLRHGEAVAIGLALDLLYSVRREYLPRGCADRILSLLEAVGFQLWDDALVARAADGGLLLLAGLREFREHLGGELHITLIRDVGQPFEVTEMEESSVVGAIDDLMLRAMTHGAGGLLPLLGVNGPR